MVQRDLANLVRAAAALGALGLALLAACARPPSAPQAQLDPTSLRTTAQGELVGFTGRYGSHVWLGIPYAQPPVGELRWRAPLPPRPWSGRREALKHGPVCPQFPTLIGGLADRKAGVPVGDEDCLTLSVYAPRLAPAELPRSGEGKPVMVWIHGGGNTYGHVGFYDGGNLAQRHDVVVVMLQYRLGALGWLRHASLRADASSPEEASGNFATLDLIRGLEWVRDNIAAFGGNPGNVTIFGESAGGRDVITLLVAPGAKGLFHRAISESGSVRMDSLAEAENYVDAPQPGSPKSSAELVLQLLQDDGKAVDREEAKRVAAKLGDAELARYLRGKSAPELLRAAHGAKGDVPPVNLPNIFPDGRVLPSGGILEALSRPDGHASVPTVLGTNRDENRLFMLIDPNYTRVWFGVLYRARDPEFYAATADSVSRMWKVDGADGPAAVLAAQQPNVYVYRFDWDEEPSVLGADFSKLLGAAHFGEVPFVFDHTDVGPLGRVVFSEANKPGREILSKQMMSYWAEFARAGNPGRGRGGDLPAWMAWDSAPGKPKMMIFDTPPDAGAKPPRAEPAGVGAAGPAAGGTRMSADQLTAERVLEEIDSDPRLADKAKRCDVLRQLVVRHNLSAENYAQRCPDRPLKAVSATR